MYYDPRQSVSVTSAVCIAVYCLNVLVGDGLIVNNGSVYTLWHKRNFRCFDSKNQLLIHRLMKGIVFRSVVLLNVSNVVDSMEQRIDRRLTLYLRASAGSR